MKLTTQHVIVIALIMVAVVVVVVMGKDPTPIIGLALAILIGIGLVQQGEIKNAANGTMSRLITLMETMAEHHLHQLPPPSTTLNGEFVEEKPSNGGKK